MVEECTARRAVPRNVRPFHMCIAALSFKGRRLQEQTKQ